MNMAAGHRELELLWQSVAAADAASTPNLADSKLLQSCSNDKGGAAQFFAALRSSTHSAVHAADVPAVLETGVACLLKFLQINLCGPVSSEHTPLWQQQDSAAAADPQDGPAGTWGRQGPEHKLGQDTMSEDERWVVSQLEVDGEDVVGRVRGLDLLLAALLCIAEPMGYLTTTDTQQQQQQQKQQQSVLDQAKLQELQLGSWCWWCLRAVMLQQHVLSGRSITLHTSLKQLVQDTLSWADALPAAAAAAGSNGSNAGQQQPVVATGAAVQAQVLSAVAHIEAALVQQSIGVVTGAQQQLEAAAAALDVTVELTGALGLRTKHQIDPKAQMVAAVRAAAAGGNGRNAAALPGLEGFNVAALGFEEIGLTKELEGMIDESAVYLAPRLVQPLGTAAAAAGSGGSDAVAEAAKATGVSISSSSSEAQTAPAIVQQQQQQQQQQLSPLLQALLLGWAAQIRKGTSRDELQQWQMAPFVEAVLQQQQTQYMLHATARLLKCRHEKARGRTRERALMQLEQLCSALEAGQPQAGRRLPYVFGVRFPLWPLLRKELAEFYIAMGFVGGALKIFEALEMWDQLIVCYRLLDKKQAAQELVLARLKACPSDAKLWCALGDITQQDEHYVKAWQVSNHRSSRAQRSLGRAAVRRKEYAAAASAYEAALALNPLYPDVWFSLGYCYLRLEQTHKALQAFSKVTHQEPEHGEAWANLSALWLQEGGWREALHAAEQAVKLKRDSWQTWDNYALAASKADAPIACVRGLAEVFDLTQGQRFPLQTAEGLIDLLEQQHKHLHSGSPKTCFTDAATAAPAADEDAASAEVSGDGELMVPSEQLLQMLSFTAGLPGAGPDSSTAGSAAASASAAATAAAHQRNHQQAVQQFGGVLKQVANSPACGAAVWGLLGRWYALQGQHLSSQEARLKQVRALQNSPYKSDADAFAAMADASAQLCRAYLASAAAGTGGVRELAAGRMHLKGLLKQCQAAFEERQEYKQLQELLQQLVKAEDTAVASKKQAAV